MDMERARREEPRWLILSALNAARPVGAPETIVKNAVETVILDVTALEIRNQLDYLAERNLITIAHRDGPVWFAKINNHGMDIVEYTIDVHPGIARPKKYW